MNKYKTLSFFSILLMAAFALTGILNIKNLNLTGLILFIGIPMYFLTLERDDLLDITTTPSTLRDKKIILLLSAPMAIKAVCITAAKLFVPAFTEFLTVQENLLSMNRILLLPLVALGEEMAWRGFFQKRLSKAIPFVPSLVITSALFAICIVRRETRLSCCMI